MPNIPVTWRNQQVVNLVTAGGQSDAAIIQLGNGNILVSWTSTSDTGAGAAAGLDVIGQLFDPLGNKLGGEFRLNGDHFLDDEQDMDMAATTAGYLVVYEDTNANGTSIRLDEYDAAGTALPNNSIVVDDNSPASPNYHNPRVAVSGAFSALIVYEEEVGGQAAIVGKVYNRATNDYGAQFTIFFRPNFPFPGTNADADVAVLANGNYVVTSNFGGADPSIKYAIVSDAGASVLSSTIVAGTGSNNDADREASVTALAGGGFVIVFTSEGSFTKIEYRVFNAAGTEIADGIAGPTGPNLDTEPCVAGLADGSFVVVLHDNQLDRMTVSHISAAGVVLGNFIFAADGEAPAVVDLADGRFAVTWKDLASGEIAMEILDTRDAPNNPGVHTPPRWVTGTTDDDFFTPSSDARIVHGWTGDDVITESNAAGQYFGDAGNDTIKPVTVIVNTFHDGGSGVDTIDWSAVGETGATFDMTAGTATNAAGTQIEQMLNFENVIGTNNSDIIIGTFGVNLLIGRGGDDTLEGGFAGFGGDVHNGGGGNDTASYANAAARVKVALDGSIPGEGEAALDTFTSVERLRGTAFGDVLRGDGGSNRLIGGNGADTLQGMAGNDTFLGGNGADALTGGTGNDFFDYTALTHRGDTIKDFHNTAGDNDTLRFTGAVFGGFPAGPLAANRFTANTTGLATTADHRFTYETDTGILRFDSNGTGAGGSLVIVTLTGAPVLTVADFTII